MVLDNFLYRLRVLTGQLRAFNSPEPAKSASGFIRTVGDKSLGSWFFARNSGKNDKEIEP